MTSFRSWVTTVRLHRGATAQSLALARILVFGIWTVFVLVDPLHQLSRLPVELFHTYGVFRLLPDSLWVAMLTPTGLLGMKLVFLTVLAWAMIGFRGARVAGIAALVVGLVYLQLKKGFGGHWDHRELTLVYVHAIMLLTPAWDAFAAHRRPRPARRPGVYGASLVAMSFIVIVQYLFIGTARTFIGGPGVFMNGTLQQWVENRNLRPNPFGFDIGTWFLAPFWSVPLDLLFLGGTVLEFVSVALLFLKPGWIKVLVAIGLVVFHASIFLMMNVAFPENMVLVLLFFDLAWPLRRLRRGHDSDGVLVYDAENPVARAVVRRAYARDLDGRMRFASFGSAPASTLALGDASAADGVAFVSDDGVARGQAAVTETYFRMPGWALFGWLRARLVDGSRPLPAQRGAAAEWFVGPVTDPEPALPHGDRVLS
ncbi:hypothetical protein [Homoserinibacter sp. GY 40078]|uniref:hypothetical protein n=1 Tax=Homoserinibacter sp. GY 40078 TaxID=2603275 RepID=UPI0011C94B73|nr:hypothetical protein [Homoserinibacter sp. GY 40078]TXK16248.1 hypothetical protein FVQ89_13395 [Homoserinibacter sp. GY 40078]